MQIEKARINLFNAIGFTVVIAGNVAAMAVAWTTYKSAIESQDKRLAQVELRVDAADQFRVARSSTTDKNFADINAKLEQVGNLPYRMGAAEEAIKQTNARFDRFSELILGSIDALRKDVNAGNDQLRKEMNQIGTKVEVLSSKIDTISDRPRQPSPPARSLP